MNSNREVIADYFSRVEVDPMSSRSLYGRDAVLYYGGSHALSGDYEGVDGILGMFEQSAKTFRPPLVLRAIDIAASDRHVIALLTATGRAGTPEEQSWLRAVVFRPADGLIIEQWLLDYDQALVASLQR